MLGQAAVHKRDTLEARMYQIEFDNKSEEQLYAGAVFWHCSMFIIKSFVGRVAD